MYFMSPTAHINKKFSSPKYNCLKNLYFQDLWSNSQTNLIKKDDGPHLSLKGFVTK